MKSILINRWVKRSLAAFAALGLALGATASVLINEVATSVDDGQMDKTSVDSGCDWVELYNDGSSSVSLSGCTVSDGKNSYTIPSGVSIGAKGFYVLYLSGAKGVRDGHLHVPFQLSMRGKETFSISGNGVSASLKVPFVPYGWSYGRASNGSSWGYFNPTTKGKSNGAVQATKAIESLSWSHKRGLYDSGFTLTIKALDGDGNTVSDAEIVWAKGGSDPSTSSTGSASISISGTTVIRAVAKKSGYAYNDKAIEASTYIFLNNVKSQGAPSNEAGNWGGKTKKWNVDLDYVSESDFKSALKAAPIVSVSSPSLFSSPGLYSGAGDRFSCNVEWVTYPEDSSINFSMGGYFKLYGAGGAGFDRTVKKSIRVTFRASRGTAKIKGKDIFCDIVKKGLCSSSCANNDDNEYKSLIFRAEHNNAWSTVDSINALPMTYVKDQFVRDLERQLSGYGTRGNWAHVFFNGLYWGVYNICERPDAELETKHYPDTAGYAYDWISTKGNNGKDWTVHDNGSGSYTASGLGSILNTCQNNFSQTYYATYSNYANAIKWIDPVALANYMNINYWTANYDWPFNNWYTVGSPRNGIPCRFYTWDVESSWDTRSLNGARMGQNTTNTGRSWDNGTQKSPQYPQVAFEKQPDYRLAFYDSVYNAFIKSGAPLSASSAPGRLRNYFNYAQTFMKGEQARWGNYRGKSNRYSTWVNNGNTFLNNNFANYINGYVNKVKSYGLYPNVSCTSWTLSSDGSYATIGSIPSGCTIYYTTDGTDPRKPGSDSNSSKSAGVVGSKNDTASTYSVGTKVYGGKSKTLKARAQNNSSKQWSYLVTITVTSGGTASHTHKWSDWKVTKEASCTEAGTQQRTCSASGCPSPTETQSIAALGHSYGSYTENPKATCTTAGKRTATCSRCNKVITEDVPALGHAWSDWETIVQPTKEKEGTKKRTCSRCSTSETGTVPKLGTYVYGAVDSKACYYTLQSAGDWANPEIWKKSSAATYGIPSNSLARTEIPSTLTSSVVVDLGGATYMTAALTNKSTKGVTFQNGTIKSYGAVANSAAGKVTFKNITMTSGSTSTDKRLTMDVEGMTFGFEGNNDFSARTLRVRYSGTLAFKDGFTDFGTATAWDPASYAEKVTMTFDNARMRANASLSTPKAFAITIKMGSNNTISNAVMDLTGTFAPAAGSSLTIDASAMSAGDYRIIKCGTFTDTASIVKNAKITSPSGVQANLMVSGGVVTLVIGGHVHNWGAWTTTKAATCTTDGSRTRTCSAADCPVKTQTEVIAALGHDWDGGVVTKAATESSTGIRTYTCKRAGCGATKTEVIPATGGGDGDLPAGYTRVEWISSDANGYFKSGIKVSQVKYFDVESKFSITDPRAVNESEYIFRDGNALNNSWLFGACTSCSYSGTGGGSDMWGPICWNMCWFQPRRASGVSHYDTRPCTKESNGEYRIHTVRNIYNGSVTSAGGIIKRGMFWYNGSEVNERYTDSGYVGGYSTAGLDREIYVFACNRNGTVSDRCYARIYSLVIKGRASSKDTLATLFNGIPCKNSSGVAGMYDTVSKTFFSSKETAFKAGKELTPSHTHLWSAWTETTKATCTTAGSRQRTCSASGCTIGTQTEDIPALGHAWGDWITTAEATEDSEGSKYRECSRCHEKETVTIPATGKLPSGYTLLESVSSGSGQYINTGVKAQKGLVAELSLKLKSVNTAKNNIVLGAYTSDQEAYIVNCTKEGTWSASIGSDSRASGGSATAGDTLYTIKTTIDSANKVTMTVNGATVVNKTYSGTMTTDPLYLFARNYNNAADNNAAMTLYSAKLYVGSTLLRDFRPCQNASGVAGLYDMANGKFYPSEKSGTPFVAGSPMTPTPTHQHVWSAWQTETAATCVAAGSEYRTCSAADCPVKRETRVVAALGHAWDNGTITIQPTETSTGLKVYKCTRCPETKEEVLPMIGGTLPAGYTELEYIASTVGGEQYIKTGLQAIPGYAFSGKIQAYANDNYHVVVGSSKSDATYRYYPFYFQQGKWAFSSGKTATSTKTMSSNTDYTLEATTQADGGTLKVNGTEVPLSLSASSVIPSTGNGYELYLFARNTGGTAGLFFAGRIYSLKVTKGSTDIANFVPCKSDTGVVGMYDTVRKHFYSSSKGEFTAGKVVTPAHTHTIVTFGAVEPTCTTGGYEAGTKCSSCGQTLTQPKAIAALGHNFGSWVIVQDATETTTGTKKRTCSRCTYTEEAIIPIKGKYEYGKEDTATGSYTWKNAADGVWADPANWTKSSGLTYGIPASATVAAIIPASMTSAIEIDLGGASYTINNLTNNSTKGVTIANGTLINQTGKSMRTFGPLTFRDVTLKGHRIYQDAGVLTFEGNNTLADGYTIHFTENKGNVLFKNGLTKVTSEFTEYYTSGLAPFKLDNARLEAVKYPGVPSDVFVTLGANNVAGQSVMKFSGEFKVPAGSKLTIDVAKATPGTYTLIEAGTLNIDNAFVTGANVINYGSMKKSVEKVGNKIVLTLTSDAPCTHPTASLIKLEAVEAGCLTPGLTEGTKCGLCGVILTPQETIVPLGHDAGEWTTNKVATCVLTGERKLLCKRCGDELSVEEIPALGHKWDEGKETKAATTTSTGERTYTCTVCHATRVETIPALQAGVSIWVGGHTNGLWSTKANWSPAQVPTAADSVNFSGKASVTVDVNPGEGVAAADALYLTGLSDVTLTGKEPLTFKATQFTKTTALLGDGAKLTLAGEGFDVLIDSIAANGYMLSADEAELCVLDGASLTMHDVSMNDISKDLATLNATGTGSKIVIDTLSQRVAGSEFNVFARDGGEVNINKLYMDGNQPCDTTIEIDDGRVKIANDFALSAGTTATSELILKGNDPKLVLGSGQATFGSQSYPGKLTVTLAPTPLWSTDEARIQAGAGALKFCKGVKVTVDCVAFGTKGTWKFPIVKPGTGGVVSDRYAVPTGDDVTLVNATDCTVSFSMESNVIYLTVTCTATPVAKNGDIYYSSLEAALEAAKANDRVTLLTDATVAALYPENDFTLDLDGHKLTTTLKINKGGFTLEDSSRTGSFVGDIEVGGANMAEGNVNLRQVTLKGAVKTLPSKVNLAISTLGVTVDTTGTALDLSQPGTYMIDTTAIKNATTGIKLDAGELLFTASSIASSGDGIVATGAAAIQIGDGSIIDSGATALKATTKLEYLGIGDQEYTEPMIIGKTAAIQATASETDVVSGVYSHEVPEALLPADYICVEKDGAWHVMYFSDISDPIPDNIANAKAGDPIDLEGKSGSLLEDGRLHVGDKTYDIPEHYHFAKSGKDFIKVINQAEADIGAIEIQPGSGEAVIGAIKDSVQGWNYRLVYSDDVSFANPKYTSWYEGDGGELLLVDPNPDGVSRFYKIEVTDVLPNAK